MKATPGPWTFIKNAAFPTIRDSNGEILAHVYGNSETVKATTRLIAAAPDLLEALKDAKFALYGNGPGNPKIDAAIRKAEVDE